MTTVLQRADFTFAEIPAPSVANGAGEGEEGGAFAAIMAVSLPMTEVAECEPAAGAPAPSANSPTSALPASADEAAPEALAPELQFTQAGPPLIGQDALPVLAAAPAIPEIAEEEGEDGAQALTSEHDMQRAVAALISGRVGEPATRSKGRTDRDPDGRKPAEPADSLQLGLPDAAIAQDGDEAGPVSPAMAGTDPSGDQPDDLPTEARLGVKDPALADGASGALTPPPAPPVAAPFGEVAAPEVEPQGGAPAARPRAGDAEIMKPTAGAALAAQGGSSVGGAEGEIQPVPIPPRPQETVAQDVWTAPVKMPAGRARGVDEPRRLPDATPASILSATEASTLAPEITAHARGASATAQPDAGPDAGVPAGGSLASTPRPLIDGAAGGPGFDGQTPPEAAMPHLADASEELQVVRGKLPDEGRVALPDRPVMVPEGAVFTPGRGNESRAPDLATSALPAMPARPALDTRRADWAEQFGAELEAARREGRFDIELSLRPKNLGELRIRIEISGSDTTVQIATETQSAARLISSHEERLAQILDASGLRLSAIAASVGAGGLAGGGRGHEKGQRNQTPAAVSVGKANRAMTGAAGIPAGQRELAERVSMINLIA